MHRQQLVVIVDKLFFEIFSFLEKRLIIRIQLLQLPFFIFILIRQLYKFSFFCSQLLRQSVELVLHLFLLIVFYFRECLLFKRGVSFVAGELPRCLLHLLQFLFGLLEFLFSFIILQH